MALRPDNANEPLLLAMGAIVIWWGRIEGMLFQETMNLELHPDVASAGVCRPLQIATDRLIAQWAKASRLVMADDPEWQDAISNTKAELTECAETRHILVHGFWDYPNEEKDALVTKVTVIKPVRTGGVKFEQYEIAWQTLADFHNRLSRLYHAVLRLTGGIGQRVPLGRSPTVQRDDE